jgi:ubiquinone/menaquinone biosynthesis C-methylase UbiE
MHNHGMRIVTDELEFLSSLVPLEGARVLELGCGKAEFSRRLVEKAGVASVTALEVDEIQHRKNLGGPQVDRLIFGYGAAEDIPYSDGTFDGVVMLKSLHHVPLDDLDRALEEVRRVLKPGGWAYISEPVFAGPLNEIIRLFHDEQAVRAAAYEALKRARSTGVLHEIAEHEFEMPARYRSYDDFHAKHVDKTHSEVDYPPAVAAEVRKRLESHMTAEGASFMRPMRVNLLKR